MQDFEHIVSVHRAGIYESNYLKANAPDGSRALWLKHNLTRPLDGPARAEIWAVFSERYGEPVVARRDVPWASLELDGNAIGFRAGDVELTRYRAKGSVADLSWDLKLSGGQSPIFHLRRPWMYTAESFPKKKILTPAPNLHFDGELRVGDERWEVADWVGLRGHNWGYEHPHSYAFGAVNLWEDGDPTRTVDGFSVQLDLNGRKTPWFSTVMARNPLIRNNGKRHLLTRCEVQPGHWSVGWSRLHRGALQLEMGAPPERFVGLRYANPDGSEKYCYNTKFAVTAFEARGKMHTSRHGELEFLFPEPLKGIPLHPAEGWAASDGDYRG